MSAPSPAPASSMAKSLPARQPFAVDYDSVGDDMVDIVANSMLNGPSSEEYAFLIYNRNCMWRCVMKFSVLRAFSTPFPDSRFSPTPRCSCTPKVAPLAALRHGVSNTRSGGRCFGTGRQSVLRFCDSSAFTVHFIATRFCASFAYTHSFLQVHIPTRPHIQPRRIVRTSYHFEHKSSNFHWLWLCWSRGRRTVSDSTIYQVPRLDSRLDDATSVRSRCCVFCLRHRRISALNCNWLEYAAITHDMWSARSLFPCLVHALIRRFQRSSRAPDAPLAGPVRAAQAHAADARRLSHHAPDRRIQLARSRQADSGRV